MRRGLVMSLILTATALAQTPPPDAAAIRRQVDSLIRTFCQGPMEDQAGLAAELATVGAPAVDYLCSLLDRRDEAFPLVAVATAVGRLGQPRSLPALARLLELPDAGVRVAAIQALERLDHSDSLPVLAAAVDDADPEVAEAAAAALLTQRVDPRRLVLTIRRRLPEAVEKARLTQVLARAANEPAHEALLELVRSGRDEVRVAALQGLRLSARNGDRLLVLALLRGPTATAVKREACILLGTMRCLESIEDLIGLLDDPGVAGSAHWALKQITGQRLKADASLWRQWWSRSRPGHQDRK